jgi:rhodanese-related sulfurtransferase
MFQSILSMLGVGGDSAVRQAPVSELKAAMAEGVVLVDVRSAGEYAGGHAPGAVNIPLDVLSGRLDELRAHDGAEIWLICQSGARSMRAAGILAGAGLKPVNVTGGTSAWRSAGYPVQ